MRKLTVYKQTVIRLIEVERERENSKQLHFQIKLQPIDQTVGKQQQLVEKTFLRRRIFKKVGKIEMPLEEKDLFYIDFGKF